MKIGLDLRMLGGGSGISRYISELSHEVLMQDKRNQYVLFFKGADESARYKQYGHKIVITGIRHYSFAEQLRLPQILTKEKVELMHFPHFNVPLQYNKPFVVTIHDLTHSKYPGRDKSRVFHRMAYKATIAHAVKKSKKVITISNAVKDEIIEYFRILADKISVVYEGVNQTFHMVDRESARSQVQKRFGIAKHYILYVGVWRRYKNLPALAAAFDLLHDRGFDCQLVLAGEQDPFYPEIRNQITDNRYHESVKILGKVSDEDLLYLYNAADLFVLPSLAEGFGLTVLEAAACGVPVACSDIPVLREIMGAGAVFFDPHNVPNMADVMSQVLSNPQKAEELANAGLRRIRHFSWKKAAEETIKLYQSV